MSGHVVVIANDSGHIEVRVTAPKDQDVGLLEVMTFGRTGATGLTVKQGESRTFTMRPNVAYQVGLPGKSEDNLWRSRAEKLFQILDNIDTASDVAKEVLPLYQELVNKELFNARSIVHVDGAGNLVWAEDVK